MKLVENGFQGFDGTELHYRAWLSDSPVATMIMTHGLGEHSGAYTRLAEGLKDSGFNIFVWDLRGHGKSKGDRGVIGEWADYTRDLVRFVQHVKGLGAFKEPLILSAHSMGGLVLLKTLLDHGTLGAVGFTLSSPLLGIAVQVPAVKRAGAHVLARLVPKFTMANEIDYKDLTHDQAIIAEYEKDT
ncbi:MAG: alpha/beta hydrolase, partial [Bdellovibrionia bacterium]